MAAFGVRNIDINGAGETCDEWAYAMAGQIYVSNIVHGYFQSTYWNSNDEHPPVGKYIYGLTSHLSGSDDYGALRTISALMSALTVWLTFLIGLRLFSLPVAITAGIVLGLLPHFVAHAKVAGLDSPSVFLYTLTVSVFLKAIEHPKLNNKGFWVAGLLASLSFATKFSNATVFIFMIAVYVYREWPQLRSKGTMSLPVSLYLLPALPLIVLFLTWPWLWREPFGQLVKTLSHWNYPVSEWFLGSYQKPPLYYYPAYLFATIPAALMVPLTMYFMKLGKALNENTEESEEWRTARLRTPHARNYIVLFWFLSSLLWSISSFKQDGIRYIYTSIPAIALMIGVGVHHLIRRVQWWPATWLGTVAYLGWQLASVHPYYLDYYNELVGGTKSVWENRLFEVGWWGEGIPRAVEHINSAAHDGATWSERGPITHTFYGLRSDLIQVDKDADYLVWSNIQSGELDLEGYDIDFQVKADGAPLVVVFIKNTTRNEMRLGLDPSATTTVPFSELGNRTKQHADELKKTGVVDPIPPENQAPREPEKTAPTSVNSDVPD
jgi:predicted membrane-bound dolichyl-phosphate-mannose-protein mannosyltransferase